MDKVRLFLTHDEDRWNDTCQATIPGGWRGQTEAITFMINGEPGEEYPFFGNTRQEVIDQVVAELQLRGLHGTLKVIQS